MTDAELTILSILAEGARHGHEIQQIIHDRGLRAWIAVGFSSVYYILNKLERIQMVSSELRNDGRGPARKLYRLTDAGRGILQTAIVELIRQPTGLGTGFELGLANLHVLVCRCAGVLACRCACVLMYWCAGGRLCVAFGGDE